MKKYLNVLKATELFRGIEEADFERLLSCLGARTVCYEKGRSIFSGGERIREFGVVLAGQVQVIQDDYYGNRSILASVGPGNLFGESFACAGVEALPVGVVASEKCEVLLVDCGRLTAPCAKACGFHGRMIQNMLRIVSMKNIALTQKIEFTSKRATREKLLAYLSAEARRAGGSRFAVPFNRQELADYLSVERSAMSAELSKLRDQGVLKYRKNEFELL